MNPVGGVRMRATVFLVSLVTIVVEIALMRELALRFWDHLAWLVISIALLGFGSSGTILVLLRRFSRVDSRSLQHLSLLGLALSIPSCLLLGDKVEVDLIQMVWQPSQILNLTILETLLGVPFIFAGMYIGLALQDEPARVPGHYGASFIGSAAGGILVLPALYLSPPRPLMLGGAVVILVAALGHRRSARQTAGWLGAGAALAVMIWLLPQGPAINADKDIPQLLAMPGSEIVAARGGPQGLVQIVRAPAFHGAPGLALAHTEPLPDQLQVTIDGQVAGSLYRSTDENDFAFLDHTTMALAYRLGPHGRVLIGPEAGTEQVGLALYHRAGEVVAVADNSSLARLKAAEMSAFIGHLYRRPGVTVVIATLRGFLHGSNRTFSLIAMPVTGGDFGGLGAAIPDPLLTLESFRSCFDRLGETGVLSVTTHAHVPPRESLRLLNMLAETLKRSGRDPRTHIAAIRNWATVTLVASKTAITTKQSDEIRRFCRARGFDLVWLPDLEPAEVNIHHVLDEPHYYHGAVNLLGAGNSHFVSGYVHDLSVPDDRKPFFHHFGRRLLTIGFPGQPGTRSRVYAEIGTLLLVAALVQATILALVLIVLPLLPAVGLAGRPMERLPVIGFFSAIGGGFMLLEMGLLQRLEIYLGHPVFAAAAVLSGFLFFGGVGSIVSSHLPEPLARRHCALGLAIAALALLYLVLLDPLLALSQAAELPARLTIVMVATGPLAMLMGMMFPLGLRRLGADRGALIPWAWSVNGFTSVVATLLAPLLAMHWGFGTVVWTAAACYALAALSSLGLNGFIIKY